MNNCTTYCEAKQCKDEFFTFAEAVGASYVEMWEAKYGGAFIDYDGNAIFIKNVKYCAPKIFVTWNDNSVSVASCAEDDPFSLEGGLVIAVMNRVYGYDNMRQLFDDWLPYTYTETVESTQEYEIAISDVRKRYKEIFKQEDNEAQAQLEQRMKIYLESCGYKVEKK